MAACIVWSIAGGIGGAAPSAYAADIAPPGMNAAAMSTFRMLAGPATSSARSSLGAHRGRRSAPIAALGWTSRRSLVVVGLLLRPLLAPGRSCPAPMSTSG